MSERCPSCGTELSFFRHSMPRFSCPECETPLKSNSVMLMLFTIGVVAILLLVLYGLTPVSMNAEILGREIALFAIKLLVGVCVYFVLARRIYKVELDQGSD